MYTDVDIIDFDVQGFDTEGLGTAVWKGGETEALTRLTRHLERKVKTNYIVTWAAVSCHMGLLAYTAYAGYHHVGFLEWLLVL